MQATQGCVPETTAWLTQQKLQKVPTVFIDEPRLMEFFFIVSYGLQSRTAYISVVSISKGFDDA